MQHTSHTMNDDEGQKSSSSHCALTRSTTVKYVNKSETSALQKPRNPDISQTLAVGAWFLRSDDAVIVAAESNRTPTLPFPAAYKPILNGRISGRVVGSANCNVEDSLQFSRDVERATVGGFPQLPLGEQSDSKKSIALSHTHPLFPPLPQYGPPSFHRDLQSWVFRVSSFFLSTSFLGFIVLAAFLASLPATCERIWLRLTFRNSDASRPFYEEELRRKSLRKEQEMAWKRGKPILGREDDHEYPLSLDDFHPTEGGPDRMVRDVGYYAHRVGLDVEEFEVQTEDGFIINLWHVYDPREYVTLANTDMSYRGPGHANIKVKKRLKDPSQKPKFAVLLVPGLLESAGTYCVNDDDSLAFYLCKSGYDVWLGNNRSGFRPKHVSLDYSDPRMWSWTIRQMGMFDLSALTSRVLDETGFEKLGLVCHSQGTAETFVALAKEQRPELGERLTVFCALAPAVYAGGLIDKIYFKFMRLLSPTAFNLVFGIHAFIPIMMSMHLILDPRIYGWLGYKVFSFLFGWTDARWDRALKPRMFQFCPVYVSAESMRWWLGSEGFAKHKCILSTEEEWRSEDREDGEWVMDGPLTHPHTSSHPPSGSNSAHDSLRRKPRGSTAWYNEQVPPFALWVAENDNLVDGGKLLRRFERGREPHVKVVHSKVIPEYEHLDVIWAMSAVDQVFREVKEVLWKTCHVRDKCRVPTGCESVSAWTRLDIEKKIEGIEQLSSNSS
ncbi:Alpha/Beta hydrolase protein [Xylaria nigripes]|nr:Alpha/Beta hydrolase protein [Xylaria nigripes]